MFKIVFIIGIIILVYLFMIFAGRRDIRQSMTFTSWNYAHRGFHNTSAGIPENSLPAMRLAVEHGYGIELDVQLTKDKRLVVFHDDMLSRVCGLDIRIQDKTYAELREFYLFDTLEKIPLLTEVLAVVDGKVPLLIEIKLTSADTSICHYLDQLLRGYHGAYCIESFNTLALRWYKKNRPDVFRGQLSANLLGRQPGRSDFLLCLLTTNLMLNFLGRPNFIAYCYKDRYNLSYQFLKRVLGIPTFGWTFTDLAAYSKYQYAFDSAIFEDFDLHQIYPVANQFYYSRRRELRTAKPLD